MKKEQKEKPILSSDALKFQKLKVCQWVSLTLTLISGVFASVMTMYYSNRPGDFGVEVPRILGFVGIGLTVLFLSLFVTFFLLTKKMFDK